MPSVERPTDAPRAVTVSFNDAAVARAILIACVTLEAAFLVLDYHVNFGRATDIGALRRMANIAREDGLASWFAATQSLLVGLTGLVYWLSARAHGESRRRRAGWLLVAALFTYMAIDDGAQLHERLGSAMSTLRGGSAWFPSFAWQPLFVPLLGVCLAMSIAFLWCELRIRLARGAVLLALALFGFAVLMDFQEGLEVRHPLNLYTELVLRFDLADFTQARFGQRPYDTLVHFSRALEETFEMLANTLVWAAMVSHAGAVIGSLHVRPVNGIQGNG